VDTSGDGIVNVILYIVVLALFLQVGIRMLRASHPSRRFPIVACAATILIGVPSLLQFVWPVIGEALRRDPPQTLEHGEWWRVFTSIAAQDGGLIAAIFNLVVIAVVVTIAEWLWGRWRTVVLFLLPSILLNLLALTWGAPGGGSSFASDGLLASVCGLAIVVSDRMLVRICALAVVAIGLVLIVLNDAHGVAIVLGAVLGVGFALPRRRRSERQTADR
jgi:membrane associated rhomboid family serine protease